jgi:predicted MFS family arabinose efflux permease
MTPAKHAVLETEPQQEQTSNFLVCGCFVLFVVDAIAYSGGLWADALKEEFGLSYAEVSVVSSATNGGFAIGCFLANVAPKSIATTRVCALFLAVLSSAVFFSASATNIAHVALTQGVLVGIGSGAIFQFNLCKIAQHVSVRKQGRVGGFIFAGVGCGFVVWSSAITGLVSHFGWRYAARVVSGLLVVTGSVGLALCTTGQRKTKLAVVPLDDEKAVEAQKFTDLEMSHERKEGANVLPLHRTQEFLQFCAFFLFASFACHTPWTHIGTVAEGSGHSAETISLTFTYVGVGSIFGRFVWGVIADHVGATNALVGNSLFVTLLMLVWPLIALTTGKAGEGLMVIFGLGFGFAQGGLVTTTSVAAMAVFKRYPPEYCQQLLGVVFGPMLLPGAMAGPVIFGALLDMGTGAYVPTLFLGASHFCATAMAVWIARSTAPDSGV